MCSWTIPSNIPVSAFGGQSLFGLFTSQIGQELAHFPTGPSLDSPFWLYLLTWHMGLFACIFWWVGVVVVPLGQTARSCAAMPVLFLSKQ